MTTGPQRRMLVAARLPVFLRRRLGGGVGMGSHHRWIFRGLYRFHLPEFSGTTTARYPRHRTSASLPENHTHGLASIFETSGVEE